MLEWSFELVLANAMHIKNVSGRKSRLGPKKAVVAVAASMLTSAYHMLRDDADYRDLEPNHFDAVDKARSVRSITPRLSLGPAVHNVRQLLFQFVGVAVTLAFLGVIAGWPSSVPPESRGVSLGEPGA